MTSAVSKQAPTSHNILVYVHVWRHLTGLSTSAADSGDMEKAQSYSKVALGLNVAGVAFTIFFIIIIIAT